MNAPRLLLINSDIKSGILAVYRRNRSKREKITSGFSSASANDDSKTLITFARVGIVLWLERK